MITGDAALNRRAYIALGLALLSILLLWVEYAIPASRPEHALTAKEASRRVASAVDTLFARHAISANQIRTWRAAAAGTTLDRIEQKVAVGPGFLSVLVNHELQALVAPAGAHVVATEHTKENVVTMHIVRNGSTMRSISFVVKPEE